MIYVLQHIFNRYLNFIDLGQKKVGVSYCILVNILFASVV